MENAFVQGLRGYYDDEMERRRRMLLEAAAREASPGLEERFLTDYEGLAEDKAQLQAAEGGLDQQRAAAQALRGYQAPRGRTVGPSSIYVENPYEAAGGFARKIAGGVLGRQANKREEEVVSPLREALIKREADAQTKGERLQLFKLQNELDAQEAAAARAGREDTREDAKLKLDQDKAALTAEATRADLAGDEVAFAVRDDQTIPYMLKYDREAGRRVPVDPSTGDLVDLRGAVAFEDSPLARQGNRSFNEPKRYINPETGEERMLAWGDNAYMDAFTQEILPPGESEGWQQESAMSESQREKAVQKFIENNQETLQLMQDIEAAEDSFREAGLEEGESPFGWLTKQSGTLGDAIRLVNDAVTGERTQENMAAVQTVINTITRLRAGLSQTAAEIENVRRETGQNMLQSPAVFMQYWGNLKEKLQNDLDIISGMASPRTLQAYRLWKGANTATLKPDASFEDKPATGRARTRRDVQESRNVEQINGKRVTRTGRTSDGKRVYQLADGTVVDEEGNPVR